MEVSQKTKNKAVTWPSDSTFEYTSEKKDTLIKKIHALQCSQSHYLQLSRYGSNLYIHQQMLG